MSAYVNAVRWRDPERQNEQDRLLREANQFSAIAGNDNFFDKGGKAYMDNMVMPQGGYIGCPMELNEKIALKCVEHQNRMEEDRQKHNDKLRQIEVETMAKDYISERKFERAQARELQQKAVIVDSDGYLRIESKLPGRKSVLSDPITNVRGISMVRIVGFESTVDIQKISCTETNEVIYLIGSECTVKGFQKALETSGIIVHFGREKSKEVYGLIYGYLIRNCGVQNCKRRFGWNKTDSGWEFASENEETLQTILQKHKVKERSYEK